MTGTCRFFLSGITFLWVAFFTLASIDAADRVALVIGNGDYRHGNPLKNPVSDAKDVAAALERCGFSLIGGKALTDLDHETMEGILSDFRKESDTAAVVLFFFAGHGLEVDGANYLVPVDAKVEDKYQVKHRTLALDEVLGSMAGDDERLKIAILDCCRDNPLGRGWSRNQSAGLAAPKSTPSGTVLLFSAAPGRVAQDGNGRNSPFTDILKTELLRPGQEIEKVFKRVGAEVKRTTGNQEPWMNSSFYGEFAFLSDSEEKMEEGKLPPPVTLAKKGTVSITSRPAGAEVRKGREILGKTPLDLDLPSGEAILFVTTPDHAGVELRLSILPGKSVSETVTLGKHASEYSSRTPDWIWISNSYNKNSPPDTDAFNEGTIFWDNGSSGNVDDASFLRRWVNGKAEKVGYRTTLVEGVYGIFYWGKSDWAPDSTGHNENHFKKWTIYPFGSGRWGKRERIATYDEFNVDDWDAIKEYKDGKDVTPLDRLPLEQRWIDMLKNAY